MLHTVAIGAWRMRGEFAKERREMALILETGAQPDFDNRQFAGSKQLLGCFDAPLHQVLNRRLSSC